MATRTVKARVEVDGEQKYKQTMQELAKSNQVVNSELKKLQERYKGAEESTEYLTKKGELLEEELTNQSAKVILLRQKLQEAKDQYGENSEEAKGWQIQLNNAEKEQYKLVNAIDENNEAMQQQGETMVSLGDAVDSVAEKLGIRLPKSAKDALNGMKGFSAGTVLAMTAVAAAVAGVVKGLKELNSLTLEAAAKADDLITESIKSGLSTSQLQAINYASPFIDVEASTITSALQKIPKALRDAQDQLEKYNEAQREAAESGKECTATLGKQAQAFGDLNISVQNADGSLRSSTDVFWEALEALNEMGETTEADALANDLFGKSYADLKPLIQDTAKAQQLMNEAVSAGFVLNDEQIAMLGEVDDAHQKLTLTIDKQKTLLAVEFAQASKTAMETFAKVVEVAGNALIDSHLISNVGQLIANIGGVVQAGADLASKIPSWLNPIKNLSNQIEILNRTISGTLNLLGLSKNEMKNYGGLGSDIAGAEWKDDVQAWVSAGGTIIGDWNYNDFDKSTGKLTRTFSTGYTGDVVSYGYMSEDQIRRLLNGNAGGTDNWRGGLTWVGEAGPELLALPQGSRIYNAQDSRAIAATGTDTARLEALMERNVMLLEEINSEFSGLKVKGRMV